MAEVTGISDPSKCGDTVLGLHGHD